MTWPDEKIIAILSLLIIALMVVGITGAEGLDVAINVVCAIGGLVTGDAIAKGGT